MKKNRNFWVVLLIVIIFVTGFVLGKGVAQESLEKKLDIFLQALSLVKGQYVNKDVDNTKLVYGSIKGLLSSLDDPYTRFMEPKAYNEMIMRLSGEYSGIGVYIGMKDKQLSVISPIEGTPGDKAGLKAGDKIIKIDGESTRDMSIEEAVSRIRGRKKTKVILTVIRGTKNPMEVPIVRDNIVVKSSKYKMLTKDIGYIRLNTFEKRAAAKEMEKAIKALKAKGAKGLILDVRGNGGGLLDNAVDIGSMFIPSGSIVQIIDREGMREVKYSSGKVIWTAPMVLLIDGGSASASEILAGALRDNHIATLIGTTSFGKASVQSVKKMQDGSAILLTIAKYLTPNGDDITKNGISPEVVVKMTTKEAEAVFLEHQEDKDRQLDKALEIVNGMIYVK